MTKERILFQRLLDLGRRAGERRAAELAADLAERAGAELPKGIKAAADREAILLSGRGIARRFALDPRLRWLILALLPLPKTGHGRRRTE
ncbi:MAG TPA: hypothetical protein VGW34_04505 [Allosphingosinicella sp.]|nr:hypothetical protein [Allosphingosinicella sp.]